MHAWICHSGNSYSFHIGVPNFSRKKTTLSTKKLVISSYFNWLKFKWIDADHPPLPAFPSKLCINEKLKLIWICWGEQCVSMATVCYNNIVTSSHKITVNIWWAVHIRCHIRIRWPYLFENTIKFCFSNLSTDSDILHLHMYFVWKTDVIHVLLYYLFKFYSR